MVAMTKGPEGTAQPTEFRFRPFALRDFLPRGNSRFGTGPFGVTLKLHNASAAIFHRIWSYLSVFIESAP